MAIISDEPYEKRGGEDSGRDSLNFTPEQHHVAAVDTPHGEGASTGVDAIQEAEPKEARAAREGASWAVEGMAIGGESLAFTPTAGLFTSGPSVGAHFHSAIEASGGVRQGSDWCSDSAPGVYRCTSDHTLGLDNISKPDENHGLVNQGSANTFEEQRHSHWSQISGEANGG